LDLRICSHSITAAAAAAAVQEHPLLRTPCFMLHPCQTAAHMQLLLQEQHSTAQAATAGAVEPLPAYIKQGPPAHAAGTGTTDTAGSSSSRPSDAASAAAEARKCGTMLCIDHRPARLGGDALLLLYMRSWFSMVAGLLGIDLLPIYASAA
jgi:hypothetical protein